MTFEIRPARPDEYSAFLRPANLVFGSVAEPEEQQEFKDLVEFDRTLAALDGSRIVGSAGAYSFQLTLPGLTTAPAAGVTLIAVLPSHRRRGILTTFMRHQLSDARERDEALAILYASESTIYRRFGYGPSSTQIEWTIDRRYGAFVSSHQSMGQLTVVDPAEASSLLPQIYERVRCLYPGAVDRRDAWWKRWLRDPASWHDGASPRFYVVHSSESGIVDGYAAYRIQETWTHGCPGNTLILNELMSETREAYAALWNYCFNSDLVTTICARNRPPDDPIRWMLVDSRRLRVSGSTDGIWTRLIDIPSALGARRYQVEDTIIFDVSDPFLPENAGRYRLEGGPDGAICRSVQSAPDLVLDIADLGAAYLGDVRLSQLQRAGRVEERTDGTAFRADAMFASSPAPWCATHF